MVLEAEKVVIDADLAMAQAALAVLMEAESNATELAAELNSNITTLEALVTSKDKACELAKDDRKAAQKAFNMAET